MSDLTVGQVFGMERCSKLVDHDITRVRDSGQGYRHFRMAVVYVLNIPTESYLISKLLCLIKLIVCQTKLSIIELLLQHWNQIS